MKATWQALSLPSDKDRIWDEGYKMMAVHEMDRRTSEITSREMLDSYTYDQILWLPNSKRIT